MGLHHASNHGRVLHGLEARQHLENTKRDSHSSSVKMNVPKYMKAAARPADVGSAKWIAKIAKNKAVVDTSSTAATANPNVATIYSVVYETVSADFTGATAGYTTLSDVQSLPTSVVQLENSAATSAASMNADQSAYAAAKGAASNRATTVSSVSSTYLSTVTATVSPTTVNNKSQFLNAPASHLATYSSVGATVVAGSGVQATHGSSVIGGIPLQQNRNTEGMSSAGKAGLAIGILLALAMAGGLFFYCFRRRRNPAAHSELHDEKRTSFFSSGKAMVEKRVSTMSEKSSSSATTAPRLSLRPVTQFLPSMAGAADRTEKPKSMWERRDNAAQNPFADGAGAEKRVSNPFAETTEATAASTAQVGTAAAVPVAAAAKTPNNVHRVQLDFKPSMDDELELKSGQLVRMLHAYDDGWVSTPFYCLNDHIADFR